MKILHLIDSDGFYGAETMIVALAQAQVKQGETPVICSTVKTEQDHPEIIKRAQQLGLEAVSLLLHGNFWEQARMIDEYATLTAVDIIHSHGYRPGILLGLYTKEHPASLVRTLHGWTHSTLISKMFLYSLVDALLLRRQDATVIVSDSMRQLPLMQLLPQKKISYIANGIDVTDVSPMIVETLKDEKLQRLCRDCFIIGSIGRLSAEKAQADMIQAVACLRKKGLQVALVIIGDGEERQLLMQLAEELRIADYIHLLGYQDEASRYLPIFDLFCLSSLTEGLPMTLLEAMRHEIPILATRVGAISKLLADGRGYLIAPSDVAALVAEVVKIIASPEEARLSAVAAHEHFNAYYSSSQMAEKYRYVYRSVLSQQ